MRRRPAPPNAAKQSTGHHPRARIAGHFLHNILYRQRFPAFPSFTKSAQLSLAATVSMECC
jgi:hypothetical protein